jgi:hypothetical protein
MCKSIIILILFLSFSNANAQTDEQIINTLSFDLFGFQQDTIFIKSIMTKTHFDYDSVSFKKITGLKIPSEIILEWKANEETEGFLAEWNEQILNTIDFIISENDTIKVKKPVFKSLSQSEIDLLFKRTKKRQNVYSISKILFDNSHENAVFHITRNPWPGDVSSDTILIKKVFGKWKIIERFDFSI